MLNIRMSVETWVQKKRKTKDVNETCEKQVSQISDELKGIYNPKKSILYHRRVHLMNL